MNKTTTVKRKLTTMRLPVDLMQRLKVAAAREGRSRSNLVEKILNDALGGKRNTPEKTEGRQDKSRELTHGNKPLFS